MTADRAIPRSAGILLSLVLVLVAAAPAMAQPGGTRDIDTYASIAGISSAEALRRLELQDAAGKLDEELSATESETFAGLWIEQNPYRVLVAFTRDADATLRRHVSGTTLAAVAESRTVPNSLRRLRADSGLLTWASEARDADLMIDVSRNRIEVRVTSVTRFAQKLAALGKTLPDTAVIVEVTDLAHAAADLYGDYPWMATMCAPADSESTTMERLIAA